MSEQFDFTINITGMNCQHCSASVTNAIKAVPNVSDVEVNLAENRAYIKGGNADKNAIIEAVRDAGFDVKN